MATFFEKVLEDSSNAALTETIVKPVVSRLEAAPRLGDQIAPIRNIDGDAVAMLVREVAAYGVGQVKAPEAAPPLVELTGGQETPQLTSLLDYDEMHRISPTRWERLQSSDDSVAVGEFRKLVEIGRQLEERNQRLTELHRWGAFSGRLEFRYQENDSVLVVDYPIPAGNKPTVSTPWSNIADSDPVADCRAFRLQVANTAGSPGVKFHISSEDLEYVLSNENLRTYYNVPVGQPFRPTVENVQELIGPGTEFIIADGGFRPETAGVDLAVSGHVRYKPVGKLLVTTDYTLDGVGIADTPNGDVEIQTGYNSTVSLKGPQSEIMLDTLSKQRFLRQASKRIPRLRAPGAFLYATIGS